MDFSLNKEQEMMRKEMRHFCKKELNDEYVKWMDENVDFPPDELWQKFIDIGFFKATVPEKYGGDGLGYFDQTILFEQICIASMSVALAVAATGLGVRIIHVMGTKEHKEQFLPLMGDGKMKTCLALTEPAGGTDILGALSTFAEEKDGRWVINGEKVFITGAHASDYMITVCKTTHEAKPAKSLSVLLVPSNSKGISITRIPKISCHHCDSVGITFSDVEIPHENLLGTKHNGWYEMLDVLNPERIWCAAMGVGLMAAVYEDAFEYTKKRHAFGGPIGRFQILQHYLADIYINMENSRNLTYKAAWLCDQNKPYHLESNMAKLIASEGALHAGRFGAEILGGYGICMEYPLQRYLRDAYQLQFSPISNEMAKNMIMQFQGLPKSWA